MKVRISRRLAAAALAPVLVAGAGLAVAGTAHAANSPVTYTSAGVNAAAGWYGFSPDEVDFTHIETYIGSSGDGSLGSLPADTGLVGLAAGATVTTNPAGGVGEALCDRDGNGEGSAAQVGEVNLGNGTLDVVEALGTFGHTALNSSGDVCDNGLLGEATGSTAVVLKVLLTGVKADDTVQAGVLYDIKDAYSYNGHHAGAGDVTFYATDLDSNASNYDIISVPAHLGHGIITDEADAGVVADTASAPEIFEAVPAPNGGALESSAPNELVRFAHVKVNANSVVTGGHEVEGSFQSNAAWSTYPVAATTDGTSGGQLYLDPSVFSADNFRVDGGTGIISPA